MDEEDLYTDDTDITDEIATEEDSDSLYSDDEDITEELIDPSFYIITGGTYNQTREYGVDEWGDLEEEDSGDSSDPTPSADDPIDLYEEITDNSSNNSGGSGTVSTANRGTFHSALADQYHSIQIIRDNLNILTSTKTKFNGRNTWDSWHLIPTSRPLINPPGFKSQFVDIPGGNGSLDFSTVLTNYPLYANRSGSFEFYVMRDYDNYYTWDTVYNRIMEYCHGQRVKLILNDDKSWYYVGRVAVNSWKSEKDWSKIVLDYQVEPFKYLIFGSWEQWLWDPFNFANGIVPRYETFNGSDGDGLIVTTTGTSVPFYYTIDETKYKVVRSMPICPTFDIRASETNSNANIKIQLQKVYSSGSTGTVVTHTIPASTSLASYRFYDMVLDDQYNYRIYMTSTKAGVSFRVWVKFRLGTF